MSKKDENVAAEGFIIDEVLGQGGLFISGTVISRSRQTVGEKMLELVTYKIATNREGSREIYLKEWNSGGNYFTVGEEICVPVSARAYGKDGRTFIDYTIYKGNRVFGDEF